MNKETTTSSDQEEEKSQARLDYEKGQGFMANEDLSQAANAFHNAFLGFQEEKNQHGIANAADKLGDICRERQEYDKALVLESLTGADSQQVKQIAEKTGLAIPAVASCLMELEHEGLAAVNGYDDGNPMMIRSADSSSSFFFPLRSSSYLSGSISTSTFPR